MALLMARMQSSAASPNMDSSYKLPAQPSTSRDHCSSGNLALRVFEKVISEPTIIEHADTMSTKKAAPQWLSPNYIDLHLRSARLVRCEAKTALDRHFERAQPRPLRRAGSHGQQKKHEEYMLIVWDPSWESPLAMQLADGPQERSFLDEAFC